MNLPPPSPQYDAANEAQTRAIIAADSQRVIATDRLAGPYARITGVGTLASGVWNATLIGVTYGGTGANLSATGGTSQVLKQTTAGGAITVGQLATTDLSDIQVGTWTPSLQFGGAAVGMTYSQQAGSYIRIGNLVFCSMAFQLSAKGSSTGIATITGLPFAARATINQAVASAFVNGVTYTAPMYFVIVANGTTITLECAITPATVPDTAFTAIANIVCNFMYFRG